MDSVRPLERIPHPNNRIFNFLHEYPFALTIIGTLGGTLCSYLTNTPLRSRITLWHSLIGLFSAGLTEFLINGLTPFQHYGYYRTAFNIYRSPIKSTTRIEKLREIQPFAGRYSPTIQSMINNLYPPS